MNEEQVKSLIRTLVTTFGGVISGWFAAKGWFSVDDVLTFLNSGTFVGVLTSIIVGAWGYFVHTKSNAVAVVDKMPEVAGVVTRPTVAGRILAHDVPSATVAPAGSPDAAAIAR